MKFRLKSPCANCPFRKDVAPFLTKDRAKEIVAALSDPNGGTFSCHKTVDYDALEAHEEEHGEDAPRDRHDEQHCAGALIVGIRTHGLNNMQRIAHRLGMFNPDELLDADAACFQNFDDFVWHHGKSAASKARKKRRRQV